MKIESFVTDLGFFLQELFDIVGTAAHNYCSKTSLDRVDERDVRREMMEATVTALRRFVNDEINELDFAIRGVALPYLKPGIRVINFL